MRLKKKKKEVWIKIQSFIGGSGSVYMFNAGNHRLKKKVRKMCLRRMLQAIVSVRGKKTRKQGPNKESEKQQTGTKPHKQETMTK